MGIELISAGFYTSIQDEGRYGYQQYGMPVGGAMDLYSMYLANILLGNPMPAECLEATVLAPVLRFTEANLFAVTGAVCGLTLSGRPIKQNKAYLAQKGDILELSAAEKGCRIYISFAGGLDVPVVMGSRSTYLKGKIGGLDGRLLKAGDKIAFREPKANLPNLNYRQVPQSYLYDMNPVQQVRIVLGPQRDNFSERGLATMLNSEYRVTNESDRMGYRLEGGVVQHKEGCDGNIISDAIPFGAIQVPGHGKPIIMMSDRQTTGGYTKIGGVISVDLPRIAQMKAGDRLHFSVCEVKEAQLLYRERIQALRDFRQLLDHQEIQAAASVKLEIDQNPYVVQVAEIR